MRNLWRIPALGPAVFNLWKLDAARKYQWTKDWLPASNPCLEIGAGPGAVLSVFREKGRRVTGLDIRDTSYDNTLRPVLYDGAAMPFADGAFDAALLFTMLHHTPDPDAILREARRVAQRLIIIEDVYDTPWQRRYTQITDKITNLEFFGHPHTNRNDQEWRETFARLNMKILHAKTHRLATIFQQAVYVIENR